VIGTLGSALMLQTATFAQAHASEAPKQQPVKTTCPVIHVGSGGAVGFMSFVSLFDVGVTRHVFAFLAPLQVHSADAMTMMEVRLWADDPEDIYSKLMRCGTNILQQA
jgi:hypothetical protein